jgi:hypothetical protein
MAHNLFKEITENGEFTDPSWMEVTESQMPGFGVTPDRLQAQSQQRNDVLKTHVPTAPSQDPQKEATEFYTSFKQLSPQAADLFVSELLKKNRDTIVKKLGI